MNLILQMTTPRTTYTVARLGAMLLIIRTTAKHLEMLLAFGISSGDYMTHHGELGLLDGMKKPWENHWNLHTCLEDWWFMVAWHIAKAIDQAAKATAKKGTSASANILSHTWPEKKPLQ